MSLKQIIGQDRAIAMLTGSIVKQRLAGSYLFCGESGVGKKTTALNFAKALNCLNTAAPSTDGHYSGSRESEKLASDLEPRTSNLSPADSCDECDSCLKMDAGVHPDLLVVSPEERLIRIEEIRLIDEALSLKPHEGRKKAVIVDDAETMNISAANAFLKTLEEPPGESLIILVSSRPELLPATIRSRCARINFSPLSLESCVRVLEGKIQGDDRSLSARLSMGRPGIALSAGLLEERTWFLDLLRSMMDGEKDAWASRDDMERWFGQMLTLLRDMAVSRVTAEPSLLLNVDLRDYLSKLSRDVDLKVIIQVYNELNRVRNQLMFNLNKSVTWNFTSSLLRKEFAR
ncbi:MAG: DNA polymerase III subunit delta' [Candidatus Sulfobium sp.]|jgi:DNA polymerase-3 subunit delta'